MLYPGDNELILELVRGSFHLELATDKDILLSTDENWSCSPGSVIFTDLFYGETCDGGYLPDKTYSPQIITPPVAVVEPEIAPPCQVIRTLQAKAMGNGLYDLGENISGVCRIMVRGKPGSTVILRHGERLNTAGELDRERIAIFHQKQEFQTDCYHLKGEWIEVWEPRFTYHGFRYVQAELNGQVQLLRLEGRVIHSDLPEVGHLETSNPELNRLLACFQHSYLANFVGIPTDCPHREKRGWTADAHLTAEAGLYFYDARDAYRQWLADFPLVQREDGAMP